MALKLIPRKLLKFFVRKKRHAIAVADFATIDKSNPIESSTLSIKLAQKCCSAPPEVTFTMVELASPNPNSSSGLSEVWEPHPSSFNLLYA